MDTGCYDTSDVLSVFKSWSYSPDACLLQLASLHVKSFWNPTFGKRPWILQDYIEYNHIFTQLEMLLKEKARCVLKINVGVRNLEETLAVQDFFIQELVESLSVPNDPLKETRLHNMWKDMENFVENGIAAELRSKPTPKESTKAKATTVLEQNVKNTEIKAGDKSQINENGTCKTPVIKPNLLNPVRELPFYWRNSQNRLAKLEDKFKNFLKSSVFKLLRQVSKDKNKIIINFSDYQNSLGNYNQDYNNLLTVRIHQSIEMLIIGLINYKYKRKRKMSEDAKNDTFINVFDNLKLDERSNDADAKEKENRRLSMINQIDMALKYNNVLKVKQLMNEEDFLLLYEEDKKKINLKTRLAMLEIQEIRQAMEKEKINELKLSWDKQSNKEVGEETKKSK